MNTSRPQHSQKLPHGGWLTGLSCMMAMSLILTATSSCTDKDPSSDQGSSAPTITFTGTTGVPSPVIEEDGGFSEVSFKASASWTATVSESRGIDWLTVSPASGEPGDAVITVTAQPNPNYEERNGAVTIACGGKTTTFTVSQKQTDAMILSTDKVEIGSDATTIEIKLKSNVNVEYEIAEEDAGWIKPSPTSRSMTEKSLYFDIAANEDIVGRTGHIGIKGAGRTEIVNIYQPGSKPSIVLGDNEAVVGSAGGEVTIEIASNISFDIEFPSCDWIREKTDGSRSSYTLRYIVDPNETYDQRSASIAISNTEHGIREEFTITQVQKDAIIVAKEDYQVSWKASELNFDIQTNIEPTISCSESWIRRVESRSRALHTMELCFDIDENTSETEARSAQIIIQGPDGSAKQVINVTQSMKTNNIVDVEITPVMVYNIQYRSDVDCYILCTALHGVSKGIFEDGTVEYNNLVFTGNGIWDGFLDYINDRISNMIATRYFPDSRRYLFRGYYSCGYLVDGGYHQPVRCLEREIFTDAPIKLTQKPDRCTAVPFYTYNRYGNYVPHGYELNNAGYLIKKGDTWRGDYNTYEFHRILGFTADEIKKLEKHFGKPADEIPTNSVEGLSVEQMIDIFELQNEPNPYIKLPAGVYRTNYSSACRVFGLIDENSSVQEGNVDYGEPLYYAFKIPEAHFFVVFPENYICAGSKRQFIESPRDIGNLDWSYTTKVIEDNDYRKATEVRVKGSKHFLWENALNGYPEYYSSPYTGENYHVFPDMKLTWEVSDTLVYYKERPEAPFVLRTHRVANPLPVGHPIYMKVNPEYAGRKVRVSKPDWINCDEEFILKESQSEFLIDIVGLDTEPRMGFVRFYLDGSDELVDEARVLVDGSGDTTTSPEVKFNCERPGYGEYGYLALGAEGGILECIGGSFYPDELSITFDADWIEPIEEDSPTSRVAAPGYNFKFRVKPNPTIETRYCKMIFTGHSYVSEKGFYQHGAPAIYTSTVVDQLRIGSTGRQGIGILKITDTMPRR
ncbi:MAG: BACON domain-containing protein, partial [Duncaniella sp.]|nr:BACON domain-containing protein [Duncaniella sp.]